MRGVWAVGLASLLAWQPASAAATGAAGAAGAAQTHLVVLDRAGNPLLDIPGAMADWMPPWP